MQDLAITKPKEVRQPDHIPVTNLVPSRHEWSVFQAMAENASKTKFAQQLGGPAGVLSIMLYARELGIPPMLAVMGGFHNVQGHIEMSARLINMRIRQEGHTVRLKQLDYAKCVLYGKRSDNGEEMEADYTMEDARRAQLVKKDSNWEKHPKDMLWARAITRLGRRLFPDVIGNAYVEGEVREVFNITPPEDEASPIPAPLDETDQGLAEPDENKLVKAEFWRKIKGKVQANEDDWPKIETKVRDFLELCAQHNEASTDQVILEAGKDEATFSAFWGNLSQHMGEAPKIDPDQSSEASGGETEQNEDPQDDDFRSAWIRLQTAGYSSYVWKNLNLIKKHPEHHDEMREKWAKLYPDAQCPIDAEKTEEHGKNDKVGNGAAIHCPGKNAKIFVKVCERSCTHADECQPYQEYVYSEMA